MLSCQALMPCSAEINHPNFTGAAALMRWKREIKKSYYFGISSKIHIWSFGGKIQEQKESQITSKCYFYY